MMEPSANPVAALDRPPTVPPPKPHRRLLNYLRTSQWFKTHLTYLVVFPFNILFGIDNFLQYDQFHIFHTVPGLIISLLLINSLPNFFRPSVQKRRHIIGGLVVSIISVSAILIGVTRPPGHDAANWFSLGTIGLSAGYFAFSRFYKWFYLVVDPMETMGRIVFSVAICIGHLWALSIMVLYDLSWSIIAYSSVLLFLSTVLTINLITVLGSETREIKKSRRLEWEKWFAPTPRPSNQIAPYSVMEYHESIGDEVEVFSYRS